MKKSNNTFIVVVKETQNQTWQGTIEWIENNQKEIFRSSLEMIKLIDSAVKQNDS